MENFRNPTFNFFTSARLKRSPEKRINKERIQDILRNTDTKIVPVYDLKLFFSEDPALRPEFIKSRDFPIDSFEFEKFIYLGEKDGKNYFCVDISSSGNIRETFLPKGSFKELRRVAGNIDREDAAVLAYARALVYWHRNHRYCGVCGSRTLITDGGHKLVCSNTECKTEHFPRTDPAVIMLVEKDGQCLLARQAKWPKGRYSTIAGYVEPGESLEQAVQREVFEETGILIDKIRYHSSQPWPFPAAVMLGFRAAALTDEIKLFDHELENAGWFSRKEIIESIEQGILGFPSFISVSFKLIQDWFDENTDIQLEELIKRSKKNLPPI